MFIYLLIYLLYDFPVCPTIVGGRSSNSEREQEENENQIEDEDEDEDSQPTPSSSSSSFLRQIDEILSKCPEKGFQRGLFSATLGPFVKELAANFLNNPITVSVGVENAGASTIDQKLIFVGREDGKLLAVRQLIQQGKLLYCYSLLVLLLSLLLLLSTSLLSS